MASSASSSTKNPPRKMARNNVIEISSNESSSIQENNPIPTTLNTTIALSITHPIISQTPPNQPIEASPLAPRALVFSAPPSSPIKPHPYLNSLEDLPPISSNPPPPPPIQDINQTIPLPTLTNFESLFPPINLSRRENRMSAQPEPFMSRDQVLSNEDLKGTRTEHGFKRAFISLFGQDVETFTSTMFLYVDQLENKLVNEKESMAEVHLTAEHNILANEQQHAEQLEFNNEGRVDQDAEQCQVKIPLLEPSPDNKTTELSNQSLESENISLKNTVAQFQKDFSIMEAHCIKKEMEVLETINIELEHSVAKLLVENVKLHKENEHSKQTYKDLYDSIKKTRVQTKDLNDSLIAQVNSKTVENADLKAQIQEKVFANAALKNKLRKLKRNSVDTKFEKSSILGKSALQPLRNQSVVRQPNAFQSKRPKFSKP
ncbi:hypothetical protein Tco_0791775 [Tanacetum coccineum]